jgi:hypothetical protein
MRAPGKLQSMPLSERVGLGSIDQKVQDRADTTRITGRTPPSTVSNDLLNLMATQKVAAEKDAALKELQRAMDQDPRTIKEKLENDAMGMTLGDMTQNTGKAINTRRQNQGKPPMPNQGGIMSTQQQPQQPAPQPRQMPNPMGGLASANPAANAGMARPMMASGGIVGFSNGGTTNPRAAKAKQAQAKAQAYKNSPEGIKEEMQRLAGIVASSRSPAAKNNAQNQINALQKQLTQVEADANKQQVSQLSPAGAGVLAPGQTLQPQGSKIPAGGIMGVAGMQQDPFTQLAQAATTTGKPPMAPGTGPIAPPTPPATATGTDTVGGIGASTTRTDEQPDPQKVRDASAGTADNLISGRLDDQGITTQLENNLALSSDPMAQEKKEFEQTADRFGIEELKNMQTTAQSEIAAAQKRYDDPKAQAARDVRNYTLAGTRGMLQGQGEREKLEVRRLRQKKADMDANNKAIFDRVKTADAEAGKVLGKMMDHNMAVTTAFTNIAGMDETAKQTLKKVKTEIEKNAQDVILKQLGIESNENLQTMIQQLQTSTKLADLYGKYETARNKYKADVFAKFMPDYSVLLAKIKKGKANDNEIKAFTQLEASINAVMGAENETFEQMFRMALAKAGGFNSTIFSKFGLSGMGSSKPSANATSSSGIMNNISPSAQNFFQQYQN